MIDPGADIPQILAILEKHKLSLKQIVVTHAHFDHIAGAQQLKVLTGAPIAFNQADLHLATLLHEQPGWVGLQISPIGEVPKLDLDLRDGDQVHVEGLHGIVLLTPGHTEGSLCLYFPDHDLLLAGDTLFAGGVGRTDLPGGDWKQLLHSIRGQLLVLPEQTMVVPGHGSSTTIGEEKEHNPFLQAF